MGFQFIFVVETNKKCNSDWIYIKDTIEHFYKYDRTMIKFSVIYMNGKGNYNRKEKEIKKRVSEYRAASKSNRSKVIYCFDCDEYKSNPNDLKFLNEAKEYCDNKGYDFIWFCKDIEQVYIGQKINDSQKKKVAASFKAKKLIKDVDSNKLSVGFYQQNSSNIMCVLDQYQELVRIETNIL